LLAQLFSLIAPVAPAVFKWLMLPFWLLPAVVGLGAHENVFPFGTVGIVVFYSALAFAILRWLQRRTSKESVE